MIEISRWYQDDCTLGRLSLGDFHCFTLELPWLHNRANVSCITPGTYEYFFRNSNKNKAVLELRNVEDRSFIQIHAGNYTSQIEGCILVGDSIRHLNGDSIPDVANSAETLKKLLAIAGTKGYLTIN